VGLTYGWCRGRFGSSGAGWGCAVAQVLGDHGGCRAVEIDPDGGEMTTWGGLGEGREGAHCDVEMRRWPEGATPLPRGNGRRWCNCERGRAAA
jgi:hypothetical protein